MSRSALIKHHRADISKSEKRSTTRCELLPHFFPRYSITRVARFHASSCFPPPSKKSCPISRCTLGRKRERERKRNFRNCRNAINSVAGYRGYRGLRRKFRTQQPTLPLFLFDLSSSLSLSIFSFPLHLSPVKRIGETDTPPGTSVFGGVTGSIERRSLGVEEGLVRRTSSTKTAVYPGRTYRPHTSGGHLQPA